ncbi:MAG: nucleotidyl transferase AbiEii/AbiGii toxin family protein [Bacteroidales bacterium]|nr:nucleotidyl transferase AbiEii/AbiGii toxin family protein [Bacteroidales bacterium]
MIDAKCYTNEWITQKSLELNFNDKNLIEKVIRALSLLDMLATAGCPFYFKGGTSLMLILGETEHRLSIDIDILCPLGTNIEDYLKEFAQNGFLNYTLIERKQAGKNVPKSHSKFFYRVAYQNDNEETSFILLDVLYEDCHYIAPQKVEIKNPLIEIVGTPNTVQVPSVGDILGDKLTAFAPETIGIPYYKKERLATLEIIKQLYDIGRLFEHVDSLEITSESFKKIAKVECGYRNMPFDLKIICNDIRDTALNICSRGFIDKQKFELLQKGIISIKPFMYKTPYRIENAIVDASRVAYIITLIEHGISSVEKYSGNLSDIEEKTIGKTLTTKLNKLKISSPEAFYYWTLVEEMI